MGLLPEVADEDNPFERAARVIAAARAVASPLECAYCHLPTKHCELKSLDCALGELRRALRKYDAGK